MKTIAKVIVALLLFSSALHAEEFQWLGSFNNVASEKTGEHCDGYSLQLWRLEGKVIGLFDTHEGLCGDPPCEVIQNVIYDEKSRGLRFSVKAGEFTGAINPEGVKGNIGKEHFTLKREKRPDAEAATWNTNFTDWCAFWMKVPRCRGISEVCGSKPATKKSPADKPVKP